MSIAMARMSLGFLLILVLVRNGFSRCPASCKSTDDETVCGTNGKTYKNTCTLLKLNCTVKKGKIKVKHYGKCEKDDDRREDCLRIGRKKYLKC